jgi:hypothetical protein
VNPTLTTVANALRVGDRLGAAAPAAANAAHPNDRPQHRVGESLA